MAVPPPPPAPAGKGRATAADGRLRAPSPPTLLLRYRRAAAVITSGGLPAGSGLVGRGMVRFSFTANVAASPPKPAAEPRSGSGRVGAGAAQYHLTI